jgi:DNA-directed RNA polymerase specialized sigma24 family protein
VLCPLADKVFQFAHACVLEREAALELTRNVYSELAENLPSPGDGDTDLVALIRTAWKKLDHERQYSTLKSGHRIFQEVFAKLNLQSRAALISIDFLGFDEEQAAYALGLTEPEVCRALSTGRKILIHGNY